jgi:hypothetical protein
MACKDDCGEGDYEKAKEQTGCRSSSLTIATNPKWCLRKPMNFMNLFSRLSEISWRLFSTGEISLKSENKYSKSEYGSVSGVFQSPELREQKKSKNRQIFSFLFSMY